MIDNLCFVVYHLSSSKRNYRLLCQITAVQNVLDSCGSIPKEVTLKGAAIAPFLSKREKNFQISTQPLMSLFTPWALVFSSGQVCLPPFTYKCSTVVPWEPFAYTIRSTVLPSLGLVSGSGIMEGTVSQLL